MTLFRISTASRPVWRHAGAIMIAALLLFTGVFDGAENGIGAKAAEASPALGDVWVVDFEQALGEPFDFPYGVAQVTKVYNNEVFLAFSDWQYEFSFDALGEARRAVREDNPAYFTEVGVWFDRNEIVGLEQAGDMIRAHSNLQE